MNIGALIGALFEQAGEGWGYAYALAFVAMVADSAKPKASEARPGRVLGALLAVANLVTPFLLFVAGFWAVREGGFIAWAVVVAAIFVLILVPGFIGWFVGAVAPNAGRLFFGIAPVLACAALAFAAYVTWAPVSAALETYVLQHLISAAAK